MNPTSHYIEFRNNGYYIKEKRVSLDSLVYQWREGLSPESIRDSYPVLSLKEVYGAISFYLDHQEFVDSYLKQAEVDEIAIREQIRTQYPESAKKIDELSQLINVRA